MNGICAFMGFSNMGLIGLLSVNRPPTVLFNCIGLSRYIAITNLSIIAVFVECLRQFLIDLNQIHRHSSVPKNTSP